MQYNACLNYAHIFLCSRRYCATLRGFLPPRHGIAYIQSADRRDGQLLNVSA